MSLKQTWRLRLFGLAKIPMLFYLSPKVIELTPKRTIISIPLNWRTKNHLGSMYFAALSAGADIAGALLAMEVIKASKKPVHLSFKDFKAEFLKRPNADVYFYNQQGEEVTNFIDQVINHPGLRMNMPLHMIAKCPSISDEVVGRFTLTLSLKSK